MRFTVKGIEEGQPIPEPFAFAVPDAEQHMRLGDNRNPELRWLDAPEGTQSFVVLVMDPDVPGVADDVNQEGKTLPADLPRVDFYHWVLVDIPPTVSLIEEGEASDGVVPKGKAPGQTAKGIAGINGYTGFLAGDPDMAGVYGSYDGPCPPWNDEVVHRYTFSVFALDIPTLGLAGEFTGQQVRDAMAGHVLAEASITGTYTLDPQRR
ncbi:YbhB/YbcL family Raf kinase inhibitor-like protein [Salinicola avicenniae]|uniref:YbhB/YbcL family Raf kinase inhibitor-like protein n=1 Tax=Salinicola avicenniae TaxID=2916836 RepID=UPI002072BC14|nr:MULTISPECIES: YbhB/YbcL family Raf kinase inhibitor-like protein [unclassified Salinicola]